MRQRWQTPRAAAAVEPVTEGPAPVVRNPGVGGTRDLGVGETPVAVVRQQLLARAAVAAPSPSGGGETAILPRRRWYEEPP